MTSRPQTHGQPGARHFSAERNRRFEAGKPRGARLGPGSRAAHRTGKYFLVRRLRKKKRVAAGAGAATWRRPQTKREKKAGLVFAPVESERRRAGGAVHPDLHADQ